MRAQQNFIVEVETATGVEYVWTGDRWMQAPDGQKAHEPQFWAKLEFTKEGYIKPLEWVDSIRFDFTH
jgi:hypothetical protein